MKIQDKFKNLRKEYNDTKRAFVKDADKFRQVVRLTVNIGGYIREKCGDRVSSHEWSLHEMAQDCRIFAHRLDRIEQRLVNFGKKLTALQRRAKNPSDAAAAFTEAVDIFMGWYEMMNDFKACLKSAQAKWHDMEHAILASVG
jgi:hypothetical protein